MKIYYRNRNNVLSHTVNFFDKTDNMLKADCALLWSDIPLSEKNIAELCKEHKIRSIVVEHGLGGANDYRSDWEDNMTGNQNLPLIADELCVWSKDIRDILVKQGMAPERVHAIGSPIMYHYEFVYECEDGERLSFGNNMGVNITDPSTKKKWILNGYRAFIPQNKAANLVTFITHHDYTRQAVKVNQTILDQLRHREDLFIKTSTAYSVDEELNPFREWVKEPNEKRCLFGDINKPQNLEMLKNILSISKVVVTTIPGTINGLCWAMDVPMIVPKIDWGLKKDGKVHYDIKEADYQCDIDKIDDKIKEVIKMDTKVDQRREAAIKYMGIDLGDPVDNLMKIIRKSEVDVK